MADEGSTGGKHGKGLSIFLGIVGGVLGFVGALALAPYNRMDPIGSGMIALLFFGPMGALAGAFVGAALGRGGRDKAATEAILEASTGGKQAAPTASTATPGEAINTGAREHNVGTWLLLAIAGAAALGVLVYSKPKPAENFSLNPDGLNPVLHFEVRLPAGAPMPAEKDIRASLHARPHGMVWAKMRPDQFRRDGERPVLVGEAELAFRTGDRQIQMKFTGQPERIFYLTLPATAPHAAELGAWEARDGSESRYRAQWPGRD